jgi:hypothetical protein
MGELIRLKSGNNIDKNNCLKCEKRKEQFNLKEKSIKEELA